MRPFKKITFGHNVIDTFLLVDLGLWERNFFLSENSTHRDPNLDTQA